VTAGVAISITEGFGGELALTAVLVILTGIFGAVLVTPRLSRTGPRGGSPSVLPRTVFGAGRAFVVAPIAGTFAGIAMELNAILIAALVPLVV
jgi:putative effector of murein hydrolase